MGRPGEGSPASRVIELEEGTLPNLPVDCIARIVRSLSVNDLESLLLSSRALNAAVRDERVWFWLCKQVRGAPPAAAV